jgi:Purple acid Phosphatase, N-terminal domain
MKGSWWVLISVAAMFAFELALTAQVPVTQGPVIEIADSTSATITWSTQKPCTSRVWYGDDPDDLTQVAEDDNRGTQHRVRLEGLQPNSTYFFQVDSNSSNARAETESPAIMSLKTIAPGQQPIHNRKAVIAQRGTWNGQTGDLQR